MEQQTKNCPYCGGEIMTTAQKCKHCGKWLDGREEKKETPAPQEMPVAKEKSVIKEMPASEELKTKNCPYCGEEIMPVAKKCKHCGEWITPQGKSGKAAATEPEELPEGPVDANIPKYVNTFYWLAIIGGFITAIHSAGLTINGRAKGKVVGLIKLANWIPEEIGNLIDGIGVIGLFVLLMGLTKKLRKPMDILCGSIIALYGINTICGITGNEAMELLEFIALLLFISIVFILGLKLKGEYRNSLKTLGIGMMVWTVWFCLIFIATIIMAAIDMNEKDIQPIFLIIFLIDVIFYYVFKVCLRRANDNPQGK